MMLRISMEKDIQDLKILIDNDALMKRIKELADEINSNYDCSKTLVLICVLKAVLLARTKKGVLTQILLC